MNDSLFSVSNKCVIITGVLGQLGLAYARAFKDRGATVVGFDVHPESRVDDKIGAGYAIARYFQVDITDKQAIARAVSQLKPEQFKDAVLVNNAALDSPPGSSSITNGPLEEYSESDFDKVMNVNVKGTFLCSQVIGSEFAAAGGGSIINIGSIYGVLSPNHGVYSYRHEKGDLFYKPVSYSVSKSAIYNMTRYFATYWAKKKVRVNSLTLAGVFNRQDAEFLKAYLPLVPMGRMAECEDYIGPVVFLSSSASCYMTGANLVIDGGWTAW